MLTSKITFKETIYYLNFKTNSFLRFNLLEEKARLHYIYTSEENAPRFHLERASHSPKHFPTWPLPQSTPLPPSCCFFRRLKSVTISNSQMESKGKKISNFLNPNCFRIHMNIKFDQSERRINEDCLFIFTWITKK